MCVSRQAVFTSADNSSKDYLDLNKVKIDSLLGTSQRLENLPDIFKVGKKRYQYCGVSDGQAFPGYLYFFGANVGDWETGKIVGDPDAISPEIRASGGEIIGAPARRLVEKGTPTSRYAA